MMIAAACLLAAGASVLFWRTSATVVVAPGLARTPATPVNTRLWLAVGVIALIAVIAFSWRAGVGIQTAALMLTPVLLLSVAAMWRRAARRRSLEMQLPAFINQVIRRLTVGANLGQAIAQAAALSTKPLAPLLERTLKRAQLGEEFADAFTTEANRCGLQEMALLATVIRINHQYGGSITSALESVVKLLQQRERARRELKAMTGETRFTAWVLGTVPAIMTVYMLFVSPQYLLRMWEDDGGRQLLLLGAAMQVSGVVVLWRMVRSV